MQKEPVFFNRELSWVEFNARVLEEALDPEVPLLERWKFLTIVSSNFDEFFMVRVATLKRQVRKGDVVSCPSGLSPSKQLEKISARVHELFEELYDCLHDEIIPGLNENKLCLVRKNDYSDEQKKIAKIRFREGLFLSLTPVRVDPEKEFPFTNTLRLHILFQLSRSEEEGDNEQEADQYAVVQIPPGLDRIQWLNEENGSRCFTLIEDIILDNAGTIFQGYKIIDYCYFRITRDADLSVDEEKDEDFLEAMEEVIVNRQYSVPVRIEIRRRASENLRQMIIRAVGVDEQEVYVVPSLLGLADLSKLAFLPDFEHLQDEKWKPVSVLDPASDLALWDILKQTDILLHHPYETFDPVTKLIKQASTDPDVLAIKMTLYRTSGNSPIVKALIDAAEGGKQVTVLVELKARFDEERNIEWAEKLQQAGAIVVYGIAHLKVHSKALMIVRKELEGVMRYVHLGTGNYNDKTAKLYTDIGLMTTQEALSFEVALFFNAVTGYSTVPQMTKLVMAPHYLKAKLVTCIRREAERSTKEYPGLIRAKMNSLADPDVIIELYKASRAGVKIELNVRGICMLVPGVKGLSENISVISIVDRFLEHSRIIYFDNQGQSEVYLSSADWMPRNLYKRVELMFPVEQPEIKEKCKHILSVYFRDNVKARLLQPDGRYIRKKHGDNDPFRCQEYFHREAVKADKEKRNSPEKEFTVRRSPG